MRASHTNDEAAAAQRCAEKFFEARGKSGTVQLERERSAPLGWTHVFLARMSESKGGEA